MQHCLRVHCAFDPAEHLRRTMTVVLAVAMRPMDLHVIVAHESGMDLEHLLPCRGAGEVEIG